MGEIAEFEKRLLKMGKNQKARWHKIDLHNHTPASFDYQGNKEKAAEEYAEKIKKENISVVMFTDHGCLPTPQFAEELRKRTDALIIRGVELNVAVNAIGKKVAKDLYFHLLIGFDPSGPYPEDFWLQKIYHDCGEIEVGIGSQKVKAITKGEDALWECLRNSNAIIIPAHLHSKPDAYKSRSIDDIYKDEEFLRIAAKVFTALEIVDVKTAKFFDGKHKETNFLPKACVQSSDAHEPKRLGERVSFAQLENLTFDELKSALELPFRISLDEPKTPDAYIVGAHIDGDFLKDTWVDLSPYCNVLIGIKGSGKTSVLEAIRFALGEQVPATRAEEVNKHLNAILGPAGKVRVLLRKDDGTRVLVERSLAEPTFHLTFDDDSKKKIASAEGLKFPAHILGWHEIEHVAVDPQIRQIYLNKIAGEASLRVFDEKVQSATSSIRQRHDLAVSKFEQIVAIEIRISRLEDLRNGLKALSDGNLIDLKTKYEQCITDFQSVEAAETQLSTLGDSISQRLDDSLSGLTSVHFLGSEHLKSEVDRVRGALDHLSGEVNIAAVALKGEVAKALKTVKEAKSAGQDSFHAFREQYQAAYAKLSPEQQKLLDSHIAIAEETKDLPSLRAQHAELRGQVEELLSDLTSLCNSVVNSMDERTNLRQQRVAALSESLRTQGVKLELVPFASIWRFESLAQNHNRSWTFYQENIQRSSGVRFHSYLASGYEDIRKNLASSTYKFLLSSSDLGPLLNAFEEDDLRIEFDPRFDPGKGAEPVFRPIDQLSAGQRCTAIFPILLKLENAPLFIDQPEDNLDNRHIAEKIATSVLDSKKVRQMLFTSHNANLVVMSDPEKIIAFEGSAGNGRIEVEGYLAHPKSKITKPVLDILDGGQSALELRIKKYGATNQV